MSFKTILAGRIAGAHGVRGDIRLISYMSEPESIAKFGALEIGDGRRVEIRSLRPLKANVFAARVTGAATREEAERLAGVDLYIDRSQLPPPVAEEYYYADLIGLRAETASGEGLGRIADIFDYGAGPILVIEQGGVELLVAFNRKSVPTIDLAGGRAVIDPPAEAPDLSDHEASSSSGP